MKKSTKRLAVSGMLCALGVVILLGGSILDVLDLSVSALASFCVLWAAAELGGFYPFLIYAATAVLAFLLLPAKLPAVYYALFFGWYPIFKNAVERLPRLPAYLCKGVVFFLSLSLTVLISRLFFADADTAFVSFGVWLYLLGMLFCFVFDLALSRLRSTYLRVWRYKWKIRL